MKQYMQASALTIASNGKIVKQRYEKKINRQRISANL